MLLCVDDRAAYHGVVMTADADKPSSPIATRRRRAAILAVVAGLLTTMISVVIGFSIAVGVSRGNDFAVSESALRVTQVVFTIYVGCGLLLCVGGWRVIVGDPRGHYLTLYTALAAAILTAFCLITSLVGRGTFDYSLMLLTVPLMTYSTVVYGIRGTALTDPAHDNTT